MSVAAFIKKKKLTPKATSISIFPPTSSTPPAAARAQDREKRERARVSANCFFVPFDLEPQDKGPEVAGCPECLMGSEYSKQCSNDLRGLSYQRTDIVGSTITSLSRATNSVSKNSPEDAAAAASKASDLVSTPCVPVRCDHVSGAQCPKEDSQLIAAKEGHFSIWKRSTVQNENTPFPDLEDIVPTDSELPEADCSEVKSLCCHLSEVSEVHSVPYYSGPGSLNTCQNSSIIFGSGLLRASSGHACTRGPNPIVRFQSAQGCGYGVRKGIYRSCAQEAAGALVWTFPHGFGTSRGQCLSVPVGGPARGHLSWEGSMLRMYRPYILEASQYSATPGWESYIYCGEDHGTSSATDIPDDDYSREYLSSGMYHFMPQLCPVPSDYTGAMFSMKFIINGVDQMPNPVVMSGSTPDETKDSDNNSNNGVKNNEKGNGFPQRDAKSSSSGGEIGHEIDKAVSDVTNSAGSYEALQHSDGNKDLLGEGVEEIQTDSSTHCATIGHQMTYICSEMTAQALAASWSLQLTSEHNLRATGSLIAQFERFLYAASPVLLVSKKEFPEENSSDKMRSILLSRRLWPDVSWKHFWRCYRDYGSNGLEVKVEDHGNSSNAYFSPSLSAVQIFRRSQNSVSGNLEKISIDVQKVENSDNCSRSSSPQDPTSVKQKGQPPDLDVPSSVKSQINDRSSPLFCFPDDDAEVIFEYFEQKPPDERMPLHLKFADIMEHGCSPTHLFGDPSELELLKLRDLHPASWYAIAWHPKYSIPDDSKTHGSRSLRASFLTYHSLSHLVLRRENPDHRGNISFCVVPALGMQYNGEDERWFQPTEFAGLLCPFDGSKCMGERLRALEEVAAIFSEGLVRKNGVTSRNKHADYDSFTRRST